MKPRRMRNCGIALTAAVGALALPSTSFGWNCDASAVRGTVMGKTIEPATAGRTNADCANESSTLGANALGAPLLTMGGAATTTSAGKGAERRVLAQAGVGPTAARVGLPISLPALNLPESLRSVEVPLSSEVVGQLNGLLQDAVNGIGPLVDSTTGTVDSTTGTVDSTTGGTLDSTTGTVDSTTGTVTGTVGGTLGAVTGSAARSTSVTGSQLALSAPSVIRIDIVDALAALATGTLGSTDLLSASGIVATAGGRCVGGKPQLFGATRASGLRVLGQPLDPAQVLDRTLTLLDARTIDPSSIDLGLVKLSTGQSLPAGILSVDSVRSAIAQVLASLPDVAVPSLLGQVKVTPGSEQRSPDRLVSTGPRVQISLAGTELADVTIGRAIVSSKGSSCAVSASDMMLQCTKRRLVLEDVIADPRRRRVVLRGVADRRYAGRTVTIRLSVWNRKVARAKVRRDGSFVTTAPLPPRGWRATNLARYEATLGRERSLDLKLTRRLLVTSMKAKGGKVTISGRVVGPLAEPVRSIAVQRRVSCKKMKTVARVTPRSDGRFRVTVAAPTGAAAGVYRLGTRVRKNRSNPKTYPTFTLPRGVNLRG